MARSTLEPRSRCFLKKHFRGKLVYRSIMYDHPISMKIRRSKYLISTLGSTSSTGSTAAQLRQRIDHKCQQLYCVATYVPAVSDIFFCSAAAVVRVLVVAVRDSTKYYLRAINVFSVLHEENHPPLFVPVCPGF